MITGPAYNQILCGYGVAVTQQLPKLLSRVRVPIAAKERPSQLIQMVV